MLRPVESMGGEDAARTSGFEVKNGYFEDTHFQMALTSAKFAKDNIYTSSIDRSIRIWNRKTGQLIDSLTGHKGTVNKIKVSEDENQLVSIDLKGGIKFWDVK
jgi:WD40 repeat protein